MSARQLVSISTLVLATGIMGVIMVFVDSVESMATVFTAVSLLFLGLSFLFERLFPFRASWNTNQKDVVGDLISFVGVFGVLDTLLKILVPIGLAFMVGDLNGRTLAIPLVVQIVAVALLIELGAYVSHRMHHRTKALWRTHAMHHSSERLYTLNNFRFHPVNHLVNSVFILVPPIALGFSVESIVAYGGLSLPILVFQHANIDSEFGWLNRIFNTSEVHRWHHSGEQGEANYNYGRALVIWDQLFGTFIMPEPAGAPKSIGLLPHSKKKYPPVQQFLQQLLYGFGIDKSKVQDGLKVSQRSLSTVHKETENT